MAKDKKPKKDKTAKTAKAVKKAAAKDALKALKKDRKALLKDLAKVEAKLARLDPPAPPVSPLAPAQAPRLAPVPGAEFAAVAAGVRYKGRLDVMLARLAPGSTVAGVFTTSSTRAAPVLWCEDRIKGAEPKGAKAILVNAGNANAFTGDAGRQGVERTVAAVAKATGAPKSGIYVASTGVIGEVLPDEKITAKMADLTAALAPDNIADAARAIMTTDTFMKGASAKVDLDGTEVTITGIAKGSGMIAPDMATMLVFLFTDAKIARAPLQQMLKAHTQDTFNAITVDSDTSTSDTLLLAATGQADMRPINYNRDPRARTFRQALSALMLDLAHQVVKDGEGVTKFVEVEVTGAKSPRAARTIAMAIADSPLVKTALAGEDPNWGRIVMAVGKSGEAADRDALSIRFGDILVAEKGWVAEGYREKDGAAYMRGAELKISVDVGVGDSVGRVWTGDLTKRYIEINADYRS